MSDSDYYAVLGVRRDATAEDIRRRYRKLAQHYHPDRNPGDPQAEVRFKQVSVAATVLTDATKRAAYDQQLTSKIQGQQQVAERNAPPRSAIECGYDVTYDVSVTADEARRGVERSLRFHAADGTPYEVHITLPAGVCNGHRVRIPGAGGPAVHGTQRGDLIAVVHVLERGTANRS